MRKTLQAYTAPNAICISTPAAASSHRFCVVIISPLLFGGGRVAIRQCLQESDNLIFLFIAESEVAQLPAIHRFGIFRRRPAGHFLSGIVGLTPRERIAS